MAKGSQQEDIINKPESKIGFLVFQFQKVLLQVTHEENSVEGLRYVSYSGCYGTQDGKMDVYVPL